MIQRLLAFLALALVIAACARPPADLRVTSLNPPPDATNVPITSVISASFNVGIVTASLDGNFSLAAGNDEVAGVIDYDVSTRTATFTPDAPLAYATTYTATVSGQVRTRAGSSLDGDAQWSFTTEADPDVPEPLQSIAATADAAGIFTTLLAALEAADLDTTFADDDAGPFTVFAPTDAAFDALPDGVLDSALADTDLLTAILTYHVVDGEVFAADVLALIDAGGGSEEIETLNGAFITATFDGVNVILNGEIVVDPVDIEATNGVIHVIDGVLLPPLPPLEFVADTDYDAFVGDADVDAPMSRAFPAFTGGLAPFTFEITDGGLPPAFVTVEYFEETSGTLLLSETYEIVLEPATGEIAGATGYPGTFAGTVTVTDTLGATLEADFSLVFELSLVYLDAALENPETDFEFVRTIDGGPAIPNVAIPGDRVRVSGLNTGTLPDDGSFDLSFELVCVSARFFTSGNLTDCGSTVVINTDDGTISREALSNIGTWTFDVTVNHAASATSDVYRLNLTASTYEGPIGP